MLSLLLKFDLLAQLNINVILVIVAFNVESILFRICCCGILHSYNATGFLLFDFVIVLNNLICNQTMYNPLVCSVKKNCFYEWKMGVIYVTVVNEVGVEQ